MSHFPYIFLLFLLFFLLVYIYASFSPFFSLKNKEKKDRVYSARKTREDPGLLLGYTVVKFLLHL